MSYDLNDAQPQMAPIGELIPDGTFAKVRLTIRPGGVNGATPVDAGLLKASQSSDAKMLDCEFTVVDGPYARRKFWQSFTVAGGKLDEKGQSIGWKIAKSTFRAMIDSALGLNPQDMSEATRARRVLPGLKHLDGIVFAARIMVEPASNPQYRDQNRIANVVLPDEPQYAAIMRGETVPPEPVNAAPRKAPSAAAPGWQAPAPVWGALQPSPAAPNRGAPPQPSPAPVPAWKMPNAPAAGPAPQAPAPAAPRAPAMPAWLNG
jgi:hypothetical protein